MRAFIFPGQGAQYVGMGKALVDAHDVAKGTFAEADQALGFELSKLVFEGYSSGMGSTIFAYKPGKWETEFEKLHQRARRKRGKEQREKVEQEAARKVSEVKERAKKFGLK